MIDWIERKVTETKQAIEYHKSRGDMKRASKAETEHYNYRAMLDDVKSRLEPKEQSSTV